MQTLKNLITDTFNPTPFFKISGEASFKVGVEVKGDIPYNRCVVSVKAFSDEENQIPIATKVHWFRKYNLSKQLI